ncbi:MAG TPA: M20/M25/M40 family metallo-hydrolase [Bryobacteraceae bacterium]|jgi:acetylornithine deacetylase/succinyl-diaminopimelate desuccinylase-like protein|nr:M20/M25/M40 family metallo-hydrolase [Bryobacteraceae bacterium]
MKLAFALLASFALCAVAFAAEPDWPRVEQHATELLQHYVQIASVNPPANTAQAAEFLAHEFAAYGLEAKLFKPDASGKTNLLLRLPGRDRTKRPLLLLNHMDVVPADPSRWKQDPFSALIEGNTMWGRGTLDMKSTAIMQLTALTLLKQLGIVPPRDILFLADCDEETGGALGAGWMIANHWSELNPEYVLDEGAPGSRDLYTSGKLVFGISVADKQVLWLRVRAQGTSGHGSQPIPDNANDILLSAIERAKAFPPSNKPDALVANMRAQLGEFASNKFMNAIQQNTMSLTSLRSGVGNPPKSNVIPSIAEATLDCRLLPGQNAEEFLSEIKARINDPRVTVEELSSKPDDPQPSRTDTPLYRALVSAIEREQPGATVLPVIVPYGTDGQKFRMKGVAAYGLIPMAVDAATLATMHSDSEHIPLDQFRKGLHIYFDILRSES